MIGIEDILTFIDYSAVLQQEDRRAAYTRLPPVEVNHALLGKPPKKD
jgi:chorismate synthase